MGRSSGSVRGTCSWLRISPVKATSHALWGISNGFIWSFRCPNPVTSALDFAGILHNFRGEGQATREQVEAAMALSTEHGSPHCLAMGTILKGWALTERAEERTAQ